jgi:hypothetical protein
MVRLKHLLRTVLKLSSHANITGGCHAVLDLRFEKFEEILRSLSGLMNFGIFLDLETECTGYDTYLHRWIATVLLVPGALILIVLADYNIQRRNKGKHYARKELQSNTFFVIFFRCESHACASIWSACRIGF